ncbi:hypothetical protein AC1031_002672 [Aphanomyces cochlioides]|nr:hypothetical protein AC1031_002672 [Aphanomyces cochlioides]
MANQDRQLLLDTIREMDGEPREAARMDLLLLKNNQDLEAKVDRLTNDLDRAQVKRRELTMEVKTLRQQQKTTILEANTAHTRVKQLEHQLHHDRAACQAVEETLRAEMEALHHKNHAPATADTKEGHKKPEENHPRLALLHVDKTRLEGQLKEALHKARRLEIDSIRSTQASTERIVGLEHQVLELSSQNKTVKDEKSREVEDFSSFGRIKTSYIL